MQHKWHTINQDVSTHGLNNCELLKKTFSFSIGIGATNDLEGQECEDLTLTVTSCVCRLYGTDVEYFLVATQVMQ